MSHKNNTKFYKKKKVWVTNYWLQTSTVSVFKIKWKHIKKKEKNNNRKKQNQYIKMRLKYIWNVF